MRKKDGFLSFVKGGIIGIANIIPGVSGGSLAVSLSIYEPLLDAIGNFFKNKRKNFYILLPIVLGVIAGVLAGSKLVAYALSNFYPQTILLFVGLIFGGTSLLMRKTHSHYNLSNLLVFGFFFALVIVINFALPEAKNVSFDDMALFDYVKLFFMGIIGATTMVIPGVSGSFVLMLLGYYEPILKVISSITNFALLKSNLLVLIPFGIGAVVGIVFIAKLITRLLKTHEIKTYFAIIGFVLSSIVVLLLQLVDVKFSFGTIITCIITFVWGYLLARCIERE